MAPPASLENVIGGKLKLKTKKTGGSIGKHNSSGRPSSPAAAAAAAAAGFTSGGHGKVLSKTLDKKDSRTDAQKRHDAVLANRLAAQAKAAAQKSHKERLLEMNEKLASLTEHNDLPKIGPG